MKRRSNIKENILRLNFVYKQLRKGKSRAEILKIVMKKFAISLRQAQRYLEESEKLNAPKNIPESKSVLTINLPMSLIKRIRICAKEIGIPLSELVRVALENCLKGIILRAERKDPESS